MIDRRLADEIRARVRAQAGNRCGYCLSPQHLILGLLEIDHISLIAVSVRRYWVAAGWHPPR